MLPVDTQHTNLAIVTGYNTTVHYGGAKYLFTCYRRVFSLKEALECEACEFYKCYLAASEYNCKYKYNTRKATFGRRFK